MECQHCNGKGRTVKICEGTYCFCYPTCPVCNGTGNADGTGEVKLPGV